MKNAKETNKTEKNTNNKPKVSVIVPVYNAQKYLVQCLESLLNQTLEDIEIICVNDGSTDDSAKILADFENKDSRFKIINQENKGQSAAQNMGIGVAQGEYIGFIDSDDWADPEMFEKLYNNAKTYDSDIVMCSITVYDEKTDKYSQNDPYMNLNIFPDSFKDRFFSFKETYDFIFRICVVSWNKIYKTDYIKNFKFLEGLIFEDMLFFTDVFTSTEKVSLIKENLVYYRANVAASISNSQDLRRLNMFEILDNVEKVLRKKKLYKDLKNHFKFFKKSRLIYWYERITDEQCKKEYKKKLDKLYPNTFFKRLKDSFKEKKQLYKLNKLLKNNRVLFWGANDYLAILLNNINDKNIVGIIDVSPEKQGAFINGYEVFSPEKIKELEFDYIVPSVINIYNFDKMLKTELSDKGINVNIEKIF